MLVAVFNKLVKISVLIQFFILNSNINVVGQLNPEFHATFHSIGMYWKPATADVTIDCSVKYKTLGSSTWLSGMNLWFDPNIHTNLVEHSEQYRGSLVNLIPGTNYEIKLELSSGLIHVDTVSTLSEDFPIDSTIHLPAGTSNQQLIITQGGTPNGYLVYSGVQNGAAIDVQKNTDYAIQVKASYVIIKGIDVKGAKKHAIKLDGVQHVIIDSCDISDWGQNYTTGTFTGFGADLNSAIYSEDSSLAHITIQYNLIHHPTSDANSWEEPTPDTHPHGPQAISFKRSSGFHIIRYNSIYSDSAHKFNDAMGEFDNTSFRGFPNRDSDIYGNHISHCWDDAIEAEGAGMNVRIWGNYIDTTYVSFGLAAQSLGPLYLFRNVSNFSQRAPYPINKYNRGGQFIKIGAEPSDLQHAKGKIYIFHNTVLQPPTPWNTGLSTAGSEAGINYSSSTKVQQNITSRNNILNIRPGKKSINDSGDLEPTNDFDYDLLSGSILAIAGSEANGINGLPTYDLNNTAGVFALASNSLGYDTGEDLSNFNQNYFDNGPDMGAFEAGYPPMVFGTNSNWTNWIQSFNDSICGLSGTSNLSLTSVTTAITSTNTFGTIDLSITGGTPPYKIDWDIDGSGDWDDQEDLTLLNAGFYTVSVDDSSLCNNTLTVEITDSTMSAIEPSNSIEELIITPNPSNGIFYINSYPSLIEEATVSIYDVNQRLIQSTKMINTNLLQIDLSNEKNGLYYAVIRSNEQKIMQHKLIKTD